MRFIVVGSGLINWWVNETHVCLKGKYMLGCQTDISSCMSINRRVDAARVDAAIWKMLEKNTVLVEVKIAFEGRVLRSIYMLASAWSPVSSYFLAIFSLGIIVK